MNSKQILFSIIGLFFYLSLQGQSQYQLIYDKSQSGRMGAEILAAGNFMFTDMENRYLRPNLFPERKWTGKALNVTYRLSKTVIIDQTWANFIRVFQHEIFGHGARAREFGFEENRFHIDFPNRGGATYYGVLKNNRKLSSEERIMRSIGGAESTMLLATTLRNKWLQSGRITTAETYLYASSFASFTKGIRALDSGVRYSNSDIFSYYSALQNLHRGKPGVADFSIAHLRKRALINLANPLRYYALIVMVKDYIWGGKEEVDMPMIPVRNLEYLPLFRMGLSPFGTELYLENFLRSDRALYGAYGRIGDRFLGEHWGFGLSAHRLVNNNVFQLDANLDVWRQPAMNLGGEMITTKEAGLGGAAKLGLSIKMFRGKYPSSAYGLFGYKSAGYLEGEYLREGFFVRWGLAIQY